MNPILTFPNFTPGPVEVVSNWQQFKVPTSDLLRVRLLYKALDVTGKPIDTQLLQVQGANGFICPQGYCVRRLVFRNGAVVGAFIQQVSLAKDNKAPLVFIGSYQRSQTIQDVMMNVTSPGESQGTFGFGILSTGVVDNRFAFREQGLYTQTDVVQEFTQLPVIQELRIQGQIVKQPAFIGQQSADQSQLVGVFRVFNDDVFLYAYPYDIQCLGRIYAIDKHFIIQQTLLILEQSGPEVVAQCQSKFRDLLIECFGGPIAQLSMLAPAQQVAIENATQYLNGQRSFAGLQLQGSDDIKDQMSMICNSADYKNSAVCSCYQAQVHPCINPVCQSVGYKTSTINGYNCQEELKGMTINAQQCIQYTQYVAGGNIKGDQNLSMQCEQKMADGGVQIQQIQNEQRPAVVSSKSALSALLSEHGVDPVIALGLLLVVLAVVVLYIVLSRRAAQSSTPQQYGNLGVYSQ